jgi:hypothetical protein
MSDNDLTVTLTAKVDQALAGLSKIGTAIDKLTEKQTKLKESHKDFGEKAVVAFEAVHHGAEKALEFAEKVAHAIAEIDKNLANLSRKGGASNVGLSQSLTGLGVGGEALERTQRLLRGQQGYLNQGEIDTFVASLASENSSISGQRVAQLAGVASRGAPVIGDLSAISSLEHVFGSSVSAADIGDLAVEYKKTARGGFTGENAKGVFDVVGAGVDPFKALALSSAFNNAGEKKGLAALATYLNGGGTIEGAFAGNTGEDGLDRAIGAVKASGRSLTSIAADEARFRGVTSTDVIGTALEGLPEATKREVELRRGQRGYEINRNNAADRGVGEGAREDIEQVEDAIASLEEAGETAQAYALRQQLETYGPGYAASNLRKSSGGHVSDFLGGIFQGLNHPTSGGIKPGTGPLRPVKVEVHNANPAHD